MRWNKYIQKNVWFPTFFKPLFSYILLPALTNAIRPNVLGRKNWLFSFSEAGAKANAICLSLAETAKSNGIDFYEYLKKLLMDLPNLDIHQSNDVLEQYMPWSKNIQETCGSK